MRLWWSLLWKVGFLVVSWDFLFRVGGVVDSGGLGLGKWSIVWLVSRLVWGFGINRCC